MGGYALGVTGLALRDQPLGRKKVLSFPAFFCLVNLAALQALRNIATGRRIDRWEPQRGPAKATDSSPRERLAPIASAVDRSTT